MTSGQSRQTITAEAYLTLEAEQTYRHEFYQGEVFAMAGGTQNHNTVCGNAYMALRQHLQGSPCKVFMADIRVQVQSANAYFYPDVVVNCPAAGSGDGESVQAESPILVLEVLSDSTASWDRGGKFAAYRQLSSLQEFVLIDPAAQTVEVYRRNTAGRFELYSWSFTTTPQGSCEFASVGLKRPVGAVFDGLDAG